MVHVALFLIFCGVVCLCRRLFVPVAIVQLVLFLCFLSRLSSFYNLLTSFNIYNILSDCTWDMQWVPILEQDLLTLTVHLNSPPVSVRFMFPIFSFLYMFLYLIVFFLNLGHGFVSLSSIYGFWLSLRNFQTFFGPFIFNYSVWVTGCISVYIDVLVI